MATDTVAQIKERLIIQDIVAPYVKLRKAGRSLVGLCPFHKEKTPSFHVSPERGTWHCFGCGEGGDGFTFIEKIEGVDFKGALKLLAEKAGVTLEYRRGGGRTDNERGERLREAMNRACEWYATQFPGSPAEAYAAKRRLTGESVHAWRLGYAPEAWRLLLEALAEDGFTVEELLAAGLIKEADGKPGTYYDRFRNRLIFPIRDIAGRVVAFTGRALAADEPAKYLNSPETELYHKSEVLFGIDRAKEAIRARGFTILVEGQMDVLLAHQAGFQNAVALSGTALTSRHLRLLKRYSENLMLVLDPDPAGFKATARSAELALTEGLRVKAVRLPEGKDPADLASEDPGEFTNRIKDAKPVVDFFLAELARREKDQHRLVRAARGVVIPLVAATRSPMEQGHFVQTVARFLGLSERDVRAEVAQVRTRPDEFQPETGKKRDARPLIASPRDAREMQLLAAAFSYPDTPLAERIRSEYARITGAPPPSQTEFPEPALFQAEETFGEEPSENAADELLRAFEEAVIREAYDKAVQALRRAEAVGEAAGVVSAQKECTRLAARLAAFGN